LARSRALLAQLENQSDSPAVKHTRPSREHPQQLSLFAPPAATPPAHAHVIDLLRALDIDNLTPMEALQLVARLKREL
jgi:DNA mismatch repair protein MutS